ncbi:MAG: VOC family protein [Nitrospinae bacterium]|nr:VOC family protein [Nitrospinota bacterium]
MIPLDQLVKDYIGRFLEGNRAAADFADHLNRCGAGLMPLVDHCTIRTLDVDVRSKQFIDYGFHYDEKIGVLEFDHWWAKVYRKPGYPALFIDQAFDGDRGRDSLIPDWVRAHGDQCFHHLAIRVEDIDAAIVAIQQRGFEVAGKVVGDPGSDLRQVFTQPEKKNGAVYTVLELIERHNGYAGFLPPQADGLMESTRH